jgi:hypothetical protein
MRGSFFDTPRVRRCCLEHLELAVTGDEKIRRLDVAMHDALAMRHRQNAEQLRGHSAQRHCSQDAAPCEIF